MNFLLSEGLILTFCIIVLLVIWVMSVFGFSSHNKLLHKCESLISFCQLSHFPATFMYFSGIWGRQTNGVKLFGCHNNQQHNLDLNYAGQLGFLWADSNLFLKFLHISNGAVEVDSSVMGVEQEGKKMKVAPKMKVPLNSRLVALLICKYSFNRVRAIFLLLHCWTISVSKYDAWYKELWFSLIG